MRFLIDMNLTPRWAEALTAAGHDAVHWKSVGSADAADAAIFDYARAHGFTLITTDLDFPLILARAAEGKPGVILLRGEPLTPELRGEALIRSIAECSPDLDAGAILAPDWSDRMRARPMSLK